MTFAINGGTQTLRSKRSRTKAISRARLYLALEFLLLFFGWPALHIAGFWPWHPMYLLGITGIAAVLWLASRHTAGRELVGLSGAAEEIPRIILLFLPIASILVPGIFFCCLRIASSGFLAITL